uniref:Uncharacterized protein n=1 Tax=Aegilops tauschii TaxID=37682 RepID=M8ASC3_AEGTA
MGPQPAGSHERPVPSRLASIIGNRPSTMPPPTTPIQIQRPPPGCTSVSPWYARGCYQEEGLPFIFEVKGIDMV